MTTEWIKIYIDLLRNGKDTNAINLKRANIPNRLFKYSPLNENTLSCLKYSSVWLARAESQNDPYESSLLYSHKEMVQTIFINENFKNEFNENYGKEITDNEIDSIIINENPENKFREICRSKGVKRDYRDMSSFIKHIIQQFKDKVKKEMVISSFSESNDSILMWSHYTEKHKGICIEYNLENEHEIIKVLEPVYYSNNLTSLSKALGNKNYTNIIKEVAITKAVDWDYEKEWRIVFPNNKGGHFKMPKPKKIYLGSCFEENKKEILKKTLLDFCTRRNIPLQKVKTHDSEYRIVENNK